MDSLNSEGISFKKPKLGQVPPKRLAGKRKSPPSNAETADLAFLRTFEGPSSTIQRRIDLHSKYLEVLQDHLMYVQDKYNGELNGSLDKFIHGCFEMIERNHKVVPIGVLESGLSAAENSAMFDHIQEKLYTDQSNQKIFVARVQSGTGTSTKAVFQKICKQLLKEEAVNIIDEESETDNDADATMTETTAVPRNDKNFSLYDLKSFLAAKSSNYKIFILAEDVEYFSNAVITQLLTLMGCSELPIVFLFGATHGQFINNLVPLNSSTEFLIEKFYSVTPKERLNDFMRRILYDCTNPFKISGRIAFYLESHYQEDNFSVDSLFNSIKFCLRHHFLSPKSAFCTLDNIEDYSEDELSNLKKCLTENDSSPRKRPKNSSSSDKPQDLLASWVLKLKQWKFCLRLVCFVNLRLPDLPLGETYPRIYSSCCNGLPIGKDDDDVPISKFFKSLLGISKSDLENMLTDCIELLKSGKGFPNIDLVSTASLRFQKFADDLVEREEQASHDRSDPDIKTSTLRLRKRKQTLKELQDSLLESKRKADGTSALHVIRTEMADYLKSLLKEFAPPLDKNNFLSVFVFDDLNLLINAMFPANFLQLNEDVTRPGFSLQCECCSSHESSVVETLPDVCIIHKLISENTTKRVDLNNVYNAFVGIVQIEQPGRKSKASLKLKEDATSSYLIRFRRAVGELQHMGFVKRSKSKPDEISRLTWW